MNKREAIVYMTTEGGVVKAKGVNKYFGFDFDKGVVIDAENPDVPNHSEFAKHEVYEGQGRYYGEQYRKFYVCSTTWRHETDLGSVTMGMYNSKELLTKHSPCVKKCGITTLRIFDETE